MAEFLQKGTKKREAVEASEAHAKGAKGTKEGLKAEMGGGNLPQRHRGQWVDGMAEFFTEGNEGNEEEGGGGGREGEASEAHAKGTKERLKAEG